LTRQALLDNGVHEHDIKLITLDGEEKYFSGKAQVVSRDKYGVPLAIAKIYKDITENKLADEELKSSMLKLQQNLLGTIDAMSKTVETRDPYTAGHQKRTTEIAGEIARALGLSQEQMNGISMAGAIHDLGKISIPAGILSKPGQISRSEFSLIKDHPQTGYDILKDIDFNTPVADIVLQHHERLDGSGYPNGLAGDDILIEAQVIGVADVIEAMASHRPYRPALGIDIAIDEIKNNRGVMYDSDVLDAAVDIFSDSSYQVALA
jgi:HD-GYP domain-containing protein (c-di-GMP phosphodiesterase class II)